MSQYVLFLVLGLATGAVYAALTMGVVVTYQGSGVINFAASVMATVPLYVFDELRTYGNLTLPLPVPAVHVGVPATWVAVGIALLVAALVGATVELAVSRPLRTAPPLAKVAGAVGVMLTLQAALALKYGPEARALPTILPTGTKNLGGAIIAVDRLWLIGVTVVIGVVLALWFRRSRTGLAVQAASENERAAAFARLSPHTLGLITWVLATVLTSFVFLIAGPTLGVLAPTNLTLLVVPALAGALIARLRSVGAGLAGALALGVLQSELLFLSQTKAWWPEWAKAGLNDAVPLLVIVVVLFVLGRSIPTRGEDIRSGLPPVLLPRNRPAVVATLFLVGVLVLALTSGTYRFGVINSLATALIALSLVVLTGLVGQISLAQAAFAGAAGLFLSKLGDGLPFPISTLVAASLAAVIGVVVGLPALRIRGAQLAVVTLAAALAMQDFILANPSIASATADLIPNPSLFGIDLSVRSGNDIARIEFGLMVLVVVTVAFVLVANLMRAGTGRMMIAVRSNERAAASVGVNVAGLKLLSFALASFLAGLGGALLSYSQGQVSADSYGVLIGLSFLATAYLGGIASLSGALIAGSASALGISFVIFDENLHIGSYYPLITGLSLIATVVFNPVGIAGKTREDFDGVRAKLRRRAGGEPAAGERGSVDQLRPAQRMNRHVGEIVMSTHDVSVSYGGLKAVEDVNIEVRAGEIVGLIGPNGAGKTSLVDAITGFTPSSGTVHVGGRPVHGLPAYRRAREGLVRSWQAGELFEDLSVVDNVRVGVDKGSGLLSDCVRPNRPVPRAVRDALALLSLDSVASRKPSELSLGSQKAVGVARSLAMSPSVLLLDEPAAGLDTAESIAFGNHLERIAATGVGCLLIDHDMHLVLNVCDRIYVIEFGKQIAAGTPDQVRRDPKVLAAYLGSQQPESGDTDRHALSRAASGIEDEATFS